LVVLEGAVVTFVCTVQGKLAELLAALNSDWLKAAVSSFLKKNQG
jgi:hypothetical protein